MSITKTAFILLFFVAIQGCYMPLQQRGNNMQQNNSPHIAVNTKSQKKKLVMPSFALVDAVIDYKKKYHEWPYPLESACKTKDCNNAYKSLMDNGMERVKIQYMGKDTLLADFEFSVSKHARSKGSSDTYILDIIPGQYLFVADSSFRFFKVLLGKEMLRKKRNV
jgi:hypothetical protein